MHLLCKTPDCPNIPQPVHNGYCCFRCYETGGHAHGSRCPGTWDDAPHDPGPDPLRLENRINKVATRVETLEYQVNFLKASVVVLASLVLMAFKY